MGEYVNNEDIVWGTSEGQGGTRNFQESQD